jgi:glycosyltransferase involved in cell wall biosynthesis
MTPESRPVRVLIACDHIDYDGALHGGGRQLIELTRALDRDAVEPTICILRKASTLGRELQDDGLPFQFFGHGRFNPASLPRLVRIIRARGIDVLHLTDFGAATLGRLAGLMTGTPAILQVISHHSEHQARGFPRYVEAAYRALAPATARTLAISETVKDFAVSHMGAKRDGVEVLPYPLPEHSFSAPEPHETDGVRRLHGIGADDPVIGSVTRFFPSKGIRYLIEAFARLQPVFPTARLVLVGQGPEEGALRALAHRLGVADRVVFAGFQRRAQRYVGMFDVAAVPSVEEGFGLVALEAQALGVPVVASRAGGLPDIIADGHSGILVEIGDVPALSAALQRLLEDPGLRERMGRAAVANAARFSLTRYAGRLTQIYRELANGRTVHPSVGS